MLLHYTPEGAERQTWAFRPEKLLNVESEQIERKTGMTFGEWADALERNSVTALHALLWVMLKRKTPTLTYDQVQFALDECELELEYEDKVKYRDALRHQLANGQVETDRRDAVLAMIDALDEEIQAERPETDEVPKAEPPSETNGGAHSATPGAGTPEISTV